MEEPNQGLNQRFFREPLIKSHNALRESVGCCCKAPCAGNGHSLAKHGNEAATPDRPRPKGPSGKPAGFVALP